MITWSDVARVCRRVCVLRERGLHDEAEDVRRSLLAESIGAARTPTDTDATVAARLESLFAQETERVANAAVLAELLLPVLTEKLRAFTTPPATAPVAGSPGPISPRLPPPRKAAVSIADFIDVMIAQENSPDPSAPGARRRAS